MGMGWELRIGRGVRDVRLVRNEIVGGSRDVFKRSTYAADSMHNIRCAYQFVVPDGYRNLTSI
jgi:hypothetical protein